MFKTTSSIDVFSQRRQEIGHQVRDLIAVRGPRTAAQKATLAALLREADELESGISREHERRQDAAFATWLRNGRVEDHSLLRRIEQRDMGVFGGAGSGLATGAGALVPVGFDQAVVSAMKDFSPLLALANVVDAEHGRPHPYPSDNDAAQIGELLGEGAQASTADVGGPSQVILNSYKFSSKIIKLSMELLQDQEVELPVYLSKRFGVRIGRVISQYLTLGNGTNQPLSFLNGPNVVNAGVAVGAGANDGSSGPNSLGLADFAELENAVDPTYRPNCRFMVHPSTLQALRKQTDKQGRALYPGLNSPDGVKRVMGYELVTNPYMDTLPTQSSSPTITRKPVFLGDFSKYTVRRTPMAVFQMTERWAEFGQVGFLAIQRADGNWTDQGACAAFLEVVF